MRTLSLISALFLLLALPASSYALVGFGLDASVGGWMQGDPSGTISDKGEDLDLVDDFGFEGKTRMNVRAKIEHPVPVLPNFYIMYTPMEFEGSETRTQQFTFGDLTFDAGAKFDTKMDLSHYDIALFYNLPFLSTATADKLDAEFGINARILTLSAEVRGQAGGLTKTESTGTMTVPVPMLYLAGEVNPIDMLGVGVEARLLPLGSSHYYSIIARLKARPIPLAFIGVGYRYDDLVIESDDTSVDMTFSGPFIEAGVEFK
jgi:outer membrane protein